MASNTFSVSRMSRFVDALVEQGCRVREGRKGWVVYCPDGETTLHVHKSISDSKAVERLKMQVRRAKLEWPGI